MSLTKDHCYEPTYISNPNSSDDLSSPENCSSTLNSDHHQQNLGFLFYPSEETTIDQDHNSLMDFNTSSFFNHLTNGGGAFSVLDGNMSYGSGAALSTSKTNDRICYDYTDWSHHHQMDSSISPRVIKTPNSFDRRNSFGLTSDSKTNNGNNREWLYSDSTIVNICSRHESSSPKLAGNKRPFMGENTQLSKKPSGGNKAKPKATTSHKDPQCLAAKNRRERISERLKVLQELVPNGTKVDLVTMLEKAIGYVKFLQLQVKVLAADEFWPAKGGKAPDISQVKEAIDAILLSSQQDRNSN